MKKKTTKYFSTFRWQVSITALLLPEMELSRILNRAETVQFEWLGWNSKHLINNGCIYIDRVVTVGCVAYKPFNISNSNNENRI
jgi:hypothetical protein